MFKNRCIIFGANGFIGSHLTHTLAKKGFSVIAFVKKDSELSSLIAEVKNKVIIVNGNFRNKNLLSKIIQKNDIVFDLVTSTSPYSSMQYPLRVVQEDILFHESFIRIACEKKVNKIIFASSGGGVYGEKNKFPISENVIPEPVSPHAIGKITIEYFLQYHARLNNINYLIYRISNPYGPGQMPEKGFGIVPTLFNEVMNDKRPVLFNNGELIRDYIYIDDLIEAFMLSFNKKTKHNVYNIGSGQGTSLNEIWKIIQTLTQTSLQPDYREKRPIDVDKVILDIARFQAEFNWKSATPINRGLTNTWNSIMKYMYI